MCLAVDAVNIDQRQSRSCKGPAQSVSLVLVWQIFRSLARHLLLFSFRVVRFCMVPTFGSLFAGIGGFDLGFERAGMKCAWQVENDPYAIRVLEKHWPEVRRCKDVREFPPMPSREWEVDIICGGFPCQDISVAGKGQGLSGPQSSLWFEFLRTIRVLRPKIAVIENVAAILVRGIDELLVGLAKSGYDAEWDVLPAYSFGAAHERERVFIIAYSQSERGIKNVRDGSCFGAGAGAISGFMDCHVHCLEELEQRLGECSVLRETDGIPCRVDRLEGLGNAVVPQVAEYIGKQLMKIVRPE